MPVRPQRPFGFEAPKCARCGCNKNVYPHSFCWDEAAPDVQGSLPSEQENPPEEKDGTAVLVSGGKSGMYWTLRRDV